MGQISDVVARLSSLPVTVINSHSHFDHVGGNAEFKNIWNRDLPYTRKNMRGQPNIYSRDTLAPSASAGHCLPGPILSRIQFVLGRVLTGCESRAAINLGGRIIEVISLQDIRRIHLRCSIVQTGCCSRATLFIPAQFISSCPRLTLRHTHVRLRDWRRSNRRSQSSCPRTTCHSPTQSFCCASPQRSKK